MLRKKHSKPAPEEKYFIEDLIPIEDIRDGMIITKDKRYIKILEIEPVNYQLRSGREQNEIIYSFASWLKISPVKMQFKAVTRKADSERYIESLKLDIEGSTDESAKLLTEAYIELIRNVGNQEALTRRFFLLFEYDATLNYKNTYNYDDIYASLNNVVHNAKNYFRQCGNHIIAPDNENLFLGEVLYLYFNKRSSVNEPFQTRFNRVIEDICAEKGLDRYNDPLPDIPISYFVGPRGVDLTHANYLVMDGMYFTYIYITQNGYPSRVSGGWLSAIVNAGEGVDIDLYLRREDRSSTIDRVSRKIRLNSSKARDMYESASDYEEVTNAIQAGYFIKQSMGSYNEDLFYMNTIITISGATYDEMLWRKQNVVDMLKAMDIETRECRFMMEEMLKSTMPLNQISKPVYDRSKRNVMTSGAAAGYLFTSYELCDSNGILLGTNRQNNSLCILDLFNTKVYKNANLSLLGTSGAGKTYLLQLMALRMRMRQIQSIIIAPCKGMEYARACKSIGGSFIKISPGSRSAINPFAIRPTVKPDMALIDGEAYSESSLLIKKIQKLTVFFSLVIPDMTNEEEMMLDEALHTLYGRYGIVTEDNNSIYENKYGRLKKMPIFGEFLELIKDNPVMARIATITKRFVSGSTKSFNQQTNVDLDNPYTVLDLSDLENSRLLPAINYLGLDFVWDFIRSDRTQRKAVFLDEAWQLIGAQSNKHAAEFVLEVFKTVRAYACAGIVATQDLSDFFALDDGRYGKAIINVCKTKVALNLEHNEALMVQDAYDLTDTEINNIERFAQGEGLIITNSNKIPVKIRSSRMEHDLITTTHGDLSRIMQELKQQSEGGVV